LSGGAPGVVSGEVSEVDADDEGGDVGYAVAEAFAGDVVVVGG